MMKNKIILLTLLFALLAGSICWQFASQKDDVSQYVPSEIPVTADGDRALTNIRKRITDAGSRNNFHSLEKLFNMSKADRELAKIERKCDPVKEQLALLQEHSQLVKDDKWQIFTLEKNSSVRILRAETANDRKLSIVLVKRKSGYRISAVKLG
ncbi:MAG: hypothetical protein E7058_02020 [Lentisphaerae bacterium]|nr:hypothetical protein [Lentisphaerota bacterium]